MYNDKQLAGFKNTWLTIERGNNPKSYMTIMSPSNVRGRNYKATS